MRIGWEASAGGWRGRGEATATAGSAPRRKGLVVIIDDLSGVLWVTCDGSGTLTMVVVDGFSDTQRRRLIQALLVV